MSPLDNVKFFEFPQRCESGRGCLTVLEESTQNWPFPVKRVFYITDVPCQATRGGHAHKINNELLICVAGAIDLYLSDGTDKIRVRLDNPAKGVLIPPDVWAEMYDFTPETVLLVLCSHNYDQENYINDYIEFKKYIKENYR